jgi:hypothetical protein
MAKKILCMYIIRTELDQVIKQTHLSHPHGVKIILDQNNIVRLVLRQFGNVLKPKIKKVTW